MYESKNHKQKQRHKFTSTQHEISLDIFLLVVANPLSYHFREINPLLGHLLPVLAHEISAQFLLRAGTEPLPRCIIYPTVNL
jgi:hypothetical protein